MKDTNKNNVILHYLKMHFNIFKELQLFNEKGLTKFFQSNVK